MPHRVKRHGAEIVSMLLIPAFALVLCIITTIGFSLALPYDSFNYFGWALLGSILIGGFLGDLLSRTIVRRKRLRKRIHGVCYRCNRCRKIFLSETPLDG